MSVIYLLLDGLLLFGVVVWLTNLVSWIDDREDRKTWPEPTSGLRHTELRSIHIEGRLTPRTARLKELPAMNHVCTDCSFADNSFYEADLHEYVTGHVVLIDATAKVVG